MFSKVRAFCMILALLLLFFFFTFSSAARPEPAASHPRAADDVHVKTQYLEGEAEKVDEDVEMENCHGISEEECLMRRTLSAHTDYIYTQKSKP